MSVDAIDWFRGRVDTLHPAGLLGVFGVHFFFLAPLLQTAWGYTTIYVPDLPPDYRPLLGWLALVNLTGLIAYRACLWTSSRSGRPSACRVTWQLLPSRFSPLLCVLLVGSGALQLWVYSTFGGIGGYIGAFLHHKEAFLGKGWIFAISESFAPLAMLGFAEFARRRKLNGWAYVFASWAAFLVLRVFCGGLRGSRVNILVGLFFAVGLIHYWVRPMPRSLVRVGFPLLIGFMYVFSFYKDLGVDGFRLLLQGRNESITFAGRTDRSFQGVLLGDLGRSDVHAILIDRMARASNPLPLACGRTYVGAVAILVPRSLWPDRPPSKVREVTETEFGPASWVPGKLESSHVYGLIGESLLNFGPIAVPIAMGLLGFFVGRLGDFARYADLHDARRLLLPLLTSLVFIVLLLDSENVVVFVVEKMSVLWLLLYFSSRRIRAAAPPATAGGSALG